MERSIQAISKKRVESLKGKLLSPLRLVHCKSCRIGGGAAWIMTSGRHHAWSCPRYAYVDA